MTRAKVQDAVTVGGVLRSGRWPRRYDGHRDAGRHGRGKARTLRSHRKVV